MMDVSTLFSFQARTWREHETGNLYHGASGEANALKGISLKFIQKPSMGNRIDLNIDTHKAEK